MKALPALVVVTAVWGVTFVQVKDAVAIYPLFAFLALRFAIAGCTLAVPAARPGRALGGAGRGAGALRGRAPRGGLRAAEAGSSARGSRRRVS